MRIQRGAAWVRIHLKNHKNIGLSSNTGPDPVNRSFQASIHCWVIIGMPAKRHLMAFCWRADDGPLIVELGSSLPSSTIKKRKREKNVIKVGQNFLDPRMLYLHGRTLLIQGILVCRGSIYWQVFAYLPLGVTAPSLWQRLCCLPVDLQMLSRQPQR